MSAQELTGGAPGRRPTLAPSTPLHRMAQAGTDARLVHLARQGRNWRLATFLVTGIALIAVSGLVIVASRPAPPPLAVLVDKDSGTTAVLGHVGQQNYEPGVNEKRHAIGEWIKQVRSLPLDPVVLRNNWTEATAYMTAVAGSKLNAWAQSPDAPTQHVGDKTISVQIVSVLPISPTSFEVRWTETTYNSAGTPVSAEPWAATLTLTIIPPNGDADAMVNPLGIRIKDFAWHRDFAAGDGR